MNPNINALSNPVLTNPNVNAMQNLNPNAPVFNGGHQQMQQQQQMQ